MLFTFFIIINYLLVCSTSMILKCFILWGEKPFYRPFGKSDHGLFTIEDTQKHCVRLLQYFAMFSRKPYEVKKVFLFNNRGVYRKSDFRFSY